MPSTFGDSTLSAISFVLDLNQTRPDNSSSMNYAVDGLESLERFIDHPSHLFLVGGFGDKHFHFCSQALDFQELFDGLDDGFRRLTSNSTNSSTSIFPEMPFSWSARFWPGRPWPDILRKPIQVPPVPPVIR